MKTLKLVGGIFFLAGLAMLVGTVFLYSSQSNFIASAKTAQGQVIDMVRKESSDDGTTSYTYAPVVRFSDDRGLNQEFVNRNSSNPPSYSRGENVEVLYASENPGDAIIDDFWGRWGSVAILGGMGAIFSLVGGGISFWLIRQAQIKTWLRANGTQISVDFQSVERDTSITINGRHPYRVYGQGKNPFTGKLQQFPSEALWVDPTSELQGTKLKVFIDPSKPSRNLVDVDRFLDGD